MKTTAEIIGHYRSNPLTGDRMTIYEWKGPAHGVAAAMPMLLKQTELPWPIEVLDEDWYRQRVYICRTDYPWPWPLACNRLQVEADRFARSWQWFQSRLIYTAQVWGLAHVNPGEMPSWGCIGKKRI